MFGDLVTKKTWKDVRERVHQVNSELAGLIDEISPSDKYHFYHVKAPFGFQLLRNGLFYLPTPENNDGIALNGPKMPKKIQEALHYNLYSNPVMLVLSKTLELYMTFAEQVIPFTLYEAGNLFGLTRILDLPTNLNPSHVEISNWDMTSGMRSCFMLPKVSQLGGHKNLQKHYGVIADQPTTLNDHWHIFSEIANSQRHKSPPWFSEFLLFSQDWFTTFHDNAWLKLWLYFYQSNKAIMAFWSNSFTWDLNFSRIQHRKNIRPTSSGVTETVKNLFAMATGSIPAFQAAQNDNGLPIKAIQDAYVNVYNLKNYMPLIMQPAYLGKHNKAPVYYSLQYHVYDTKYQINSRHSKVSAMSILDEIHRILLRHLDELTKGKLKDETTPLHEVQEKVKFQMFHTLETIGENVKLSNTLQQTDQQLTCHNYSQNMVFPESASFFRACMQMQFKSA